jgi:hypothetical protein
VSHLPNHCRTVAAASDAFPHTAQGNSDPRPYYTDNIKRASVLVALTLGLSIPAAASASSAPTAPLQSAPSRIIDRTLLCETAFQAGLRVLDIKAIGPLRAGPNAHGAGIDLYSPWSPDAYLAGISEEGLTLNHKRCKPQKTRIRLQRRGLAGGRLGQFEDAYDCTPPRFVLLRLRASFRARVALRTTVWDDQARFPVMRARGRIREGYIALQTRTGKPLVFGSVSDAGKATLFTAPFCVPD